MFAQNFLQVTNAAETRIKTLLQEYKDKNGLDAMLRVIVNGNGCCCGVAYGLEYAINSNAQDELVSQDLCIAPSALMFTTNVLLDYKVRDCQEGFKFIPLDPARACYCGDD